jgi:hypothetical protein
MGLDKTLERLLKIGASRFRGYGYFLWREKSDSLFRYQEVLMKIAQLFREGAGRLGGAVQGDQWFPLAFS